MLTKNIVWLWYALFFSVLTIPALGLLQKNNAAYLKRFENRLPTKISTEHGSVKEFTTNFEQWFNDRITFRQVMTESLSRLYYRFGVSSRPNKVVVGENGWLFTGNDWGRVIDHFRGLTEPSLQTIDDIERYFIEMQKIALRQDTPLIVAIAPNKHTIHSEHLPGWILPTEKQTVKKILQGKLEGSGVKFIDLTSAVMEAKNDTEAAFLKTNSHWNSVAAYYAFKSIMGAVRRNLPNLSGLDLEQVAIKKRSMNGDLALMLQMPELKSRDDYVVSVNREQKNIHVVKDDVQKEQNPSKGFFVHGQMAPCRIINPEIKQKKKLLFISDSFGTALAPYLSQSFHEVIRVHYGHKANSFAKLIDIYKPDAILFLMIERRMVNPLPLNWVER